MTRRTALVLLGAAALVLLSPQPRTADAHALHTTLSQITYTEKGAVVQVWIRVFTDDLAEAVSRGGSAGAAIRYVRTGFRLADRRGAAVGLEACGMRHKEDLTWICLRGVAPRGVTGGTLRNTLLFEVFDDQVNIVQLRDGGERHSILFMRGEGVRRLP